MRKQLTILSVCINFLLSTTPLLYAENPSKAVEIIIEGKQFGSIIEYKREQIKNILTRALSSLDLHDFSEEELFEILVEVRTQQTAKKPPDKPIVTENQQILTEIPVEHK